MKYHVALSVLLCCGAISCCASDQKTEITQQELATILRIVLLSDKHNTELNVKIYEANGEKLYWISMNGNKGWYKIKENNLQSLGNEIKAIHNAAFYNETKYKLVFSTIQVRD